MAFYISRFKDIEKHEFEVEVVTPLFLGSANQQKAELRAAPIKGVLRFWWRALYGSDDLEDMKRREAEVFGSTDHKSGLLVQVNAIGNTGGILQDLPQGIKVPTVSKGKKFSISIVEYLAFGLYEYKKEHKKNIYTKQHIPAGAKFRLVLRVNKAYSEQMMRTLKTLVGYGGLGSHSRNGFGSITLNESSLPIKLENQLKSYTSISNQAVLFNGFHKKDKWEDALSEIGIAYREARNKIENKHSFNKRQLIAKPIIVKREVNISDRHSKPYFLHINKLTNGKYIGQILFLPYNYHVESKRKDYFAACEAMNNIIQAKMSGGTK